MAQVPLRHLTGESAGFVDVSDDVFAAAVNEALVHQAVTMLLANRRLGTNKTKTRGEVSGGGAKPWRQKGTGRARQGSRVSPLWRGGGVTFGPVLRGYKQDMPKKMRRSAMRSGLSSRHSGGAILAVDSFVLTEPRTRDVVDVFKRLGLAGSVLVVDTRFHDNALLGARNVQQLELRDAGSLNLIDVLRPEHLVFTQAALQTIDRRLSLATRGIE